MSDRGCSGIGSKNKKKTIIFLHNYKIFSNVITKKI